MPEIRPPVRIHLNVMRARLTVIGFNIAIVSFQIALLFSAKDGLQVDGMGHAVHVVADMQLFMALALSLMAILAFITSAEYDETGVCTHWSLVSLVRSPFPRCTNVTLGIAYLFLLLLLCWITAQTVQVEAAVPDDAPGVIFSVLRELVQPLRW